MHLIFLPDRVHPSIFFLVSFEINVILKQLRHYRILENFEKNVFLSEKIKRLINSLNINELKNWLKYLILEKCVPERIKLPHISKTNIFKPYLQPPEKNSFLANLFKPGSCGDSEIYGLKETNRLLSDKTVIDLMQFNMTINIYTEFCKSHSVMIRADKDKSVLAPHFFFIR